MARELTLTEGTGQLVALVTCPSQESANELADKLVGEFAAACVNVIPKLTSVYRWQGKICRDEELLLVIKTTVNRREAVADIVWMRRVHAAAEAFRQPSASMPFTISHSVSAASATRHGRKNSMNRL